MPATKEKTLKNDFKAIRLIAILLLALFMGLFVVRGVLADFTESFEIYGNGNLGGEGDWLSYPVPSAEDWIVNQSQSYSGSKSIRYNFLTGLYDNTKNLRFIGDIKKGTISFYFYATQKPVRFNFSLCDWNEDNPDCQTWPPSNGISGCWRDCFYVKTKTHEPELNDVEFKYYGYDAEFETLAGDYLTGVWHRVIMTWEFIDELDGSITGKTRAKYNNQGWTDWYEYNSGLPVYAGHMRHVDTIVLGIENWSEEFNWAFYVDDIMLVLGEYNYPYLDLPELEDCEGLGITDRLLCEIKNFFYRIFIPSPEKIDELQTTLNAVKMKFPYNYILVVKDFMIYLKDNVNEEQDIPFSILGQTGAVSFSFFSNTTTTIAGVEQSFLDILKKFFAVIILLTFGIWCFNFIKRIFK